MREPGCQRCTLHLTTNNVCIWGEGRRSARIFLIGEAPGAEEAKQGRPFVGAAGKVLDRALSDAGLSRAEVYIANAVKCQPPGNRTPKAAEADACLPYLIEEFEAVKPAVVVVMGAAALAAITGLKAIGSSRGRLLTPRRGLYFDASIMATYHPASTLYTKGTSRGDTYPTIVEDLKLAKALSAGELKSEPIEDERVYWYPGQSTDRAVEALTRLRHARVLAADAEWTALPPRGDKVDMVWPWRRKGEMFSVSFTGRVDGSLLSLSVAWPVPEPLKTALRQLPGQVPTVYHNAMADLMWLGHEGFSRRVGADTMLLAQLLDETQPLGLEPVAVRYGGLEGGWKGHLRTERPATDDEWRDLLEYNANDTVATMRAFEGLCAGIARSGRAKEINRLHKQLLLPALDVLQRASVTGIPMDFEKVVEHEREHRELLWKAAQDLAVSTETTPLRAARLAASPKQSKEFVQHTLGLDVPNTTKPELTKVLQYPAVEAILRYRAEQKLLSTYLGPWIELMTRQGDNRLRSVFRLTGARTGRLSTEAEKGGPLMTVPRHPWVRRLIKADDGRMIVSGDFKTIEMRVAAWVAGERTMLAMFREGRDFDLHKVVAAYILACGEGVIPIADFLPQRAAWEARVTKDNRQSTKGVNFGLVYGMQEDSLREYCRTQYGVILTAEEAHLAHVSYFQLFRDLPGWHARARSAAERNGYNETIFGRRRHFAPENINAAINSPVQSIASDLTLLAMIQTDASLKREELDASILGMVHDSVIIDCSEYDANRVAVLLKHHMENVDTSAWEFQVPVPIYADLKVGRTWAD